MSTYQMCILLLFNEVDRLSYGDIREATQIAAAELKRNLQSLACVKARPTRSRNVCSRTALMAGVPVASARWLGSRNALLASGVQPCVAGEPGRKCCLVIADPCGRCACDPRAIVVCPVHHDAWPGPRTDPSRALERCQPGCAQGKNVLRKEPMGKEVGEDDVFVFNEAFSSKFYKVKVGTISAAKETEPEKAETRHKVEEDRKPQARAPAVVMSGS